MPSSWVHLEEDPSLLRAGEEAAVVADVRRLSETLQLNLQPSKFSEEETLPCMVPLLSGEVLSMCTSPSEAGTSVVYGAPTSVSCTKEELEDWAAAEALRDTVRRVLRYWRKELGVRGVLCGGAARQAAGPAVPPRKDEPVGKELQSFCSTVDHP